jgi:tetratricopeptide (TPR) repeat protein
MIRTAFILVVPFLVGCSQLTASQQATLEAGIKAYDQQNYTASVERLSTFLDEVKGKPESSRAAYVRGMSQAKLNKRAEAYTDLRLATEAPADPDTVWRAYVMLSTLYFEDGKYDSALRMAAAAVGGMPNKPPRDAMLYREGVCYERLGRWDDARKPFEQVAQEFPETTFGRAGQRRLTLNATHFAVQCGSFANIRNADTLRERLRQAGFQTYTRQEPRGATTTHVVLVGKYASFNEALSQLTAVRKHVPDAVLWP